MNPVRENHALMSFPYAVRRETRTSANYRWSCANRGKVPFVILQTTLSGEGAFEWGGRVRAVPAGCAFISITPEKGQYYYPPSAVEPWVFTWINFYGDLSIQLWGLLREAFGPVVPISANSPAGLLLGRLTRNAGGRRSKDRFEAGQEAYAFYVQLWRQLARPREARQGTVVTAIQYCRDHIQEPVSVKELAAAVGLSREHFSRAFRQRQGIAPGTFLRQQRLRNARELVLTTTLPVHEIALRCGFSSAHHFRLAFHRQYGGPPRQHRLAVVRKSVSGKWDGCCERPFGPRPRRRGGRIPAAGFDRRVNAGIGPNGPRPEGCVGTGLWAALRSPSQARCGDWLGSTPCPKPRGARNSAHPTFRTRSKTKSGVALGGKLD